MLPQAFIDRLTKQFGVPTKDAILQAFRAERLPSFRTNTVKATDEQIMEVMRETQTQFARVKTIPHAFLIRNKSDDELLASPLAKEGKIYLQGLTSMLPPLLLDPQPDETVLDLCAAPGSKTTQIAALMATPTPSINGGETPSRHSPIHGGAGGGHIVACEEDSVRFQKLLNTLRIQGATNVEPKNVDATLLHHEMPEAFDKILADVPCSAEGRIDLTNKRSYSFWSEKNIVAHAKLQRRLLRSAVGCLKLGGTLVYSTCTLAPEENELMIDWFVAEYPFMKVMPVTLPFAPFKQHKNGSVTLLPSKEVEGFFVCRLIKQS